MEEKGLIRSQGEVEAGILQLSADGQVGYALSDVAMTLKTVLDETTAYRAYFRTAERLSI